MTEDMTIIAEEAYSAAREIMDEYLVSEYYGCSGYAAMISSLIFGDASNPARRLEREGSL